jgi:16S rRNA (guanine527-N7)-methyltransferase
LTDDATSATSVAVTPAPPEAAAVFGASLPTMVAYHRWLAGAGIERGLVGPREADRLWHRHLLNCAAMSALVPPRSVLVDIGSGAGLPGIVIAVARPDVQVICVDPMQRRTAFLEEVVADLALANVEVRRARAEELGQRTRGKPSMQVDVVTARAVGSVDRLARWAAPLLAKRGALVTLKGASVVEEIRSAWPGLRRAGFAGDTELFEIGLAPDLGAASVFRVTRTAVWAASLSGPDAVTNGPADDDSRIGALADAPPLATVLRVLRSPK